MLLVVKTKVDDGIPWHRAGCYRLGVHILLKGENQIHDKKKSKG